MIDFIENGFLVQDLDSPIYSPRNFPYQGLIAYDLFPLIHFHDLESRELSQKQHCLRNDYGLLEMRELISDPNLLRRYVSECKKKGIRIRLLFLESQYQDEIWSGKAVQKRTLGYEYSPVPFDEQIISDLDWFSGLADFLPKLNKFGLFERLEDAQAFVERYDKLLLTGNLGDGLETAFLFRISIVAV